MPKRPFHPVFVFLICLCGGCLGLAGCKTTAEVSQLPNSEILDLIAPAPDFEINSLSQGWWFSGFEKSPTPTLLKENAIKRAIFEGVPALRVEAGSENFMLARYSNTRLMVSPYLSWNWLMSRHREQVHPVRLLIGFKGGAPVLKKGETEPLSEWTGENLPPHDRLLTVQWSDSALQRGHFDTSANPPVYLVRGGNEQGGSWHLETIDLEQLYRTAWPKDDIGHARIMFVAIAARKTTDQAFGLLSGMMLSR